MTGMRLAGRSTDVNGAAFKIGSDAAGIAVHGSAKSPSHVVAAGGAVAGAAMPGKDTGQWERPWRQTEGLSLSPVTEPFKRSLPQRAVTTGAFGHDGQDRAARGDMLLGAVAAQHRAFAFADELAALSRRCGPAQRLRDVGIPVDALPMMAADATKQTRLLANNPCPFTEADALALYRQAF